MNDLEKPLGNTELRMSLASIESEIVEVKGIAVQSLEQVKKTNGRVTMHDKLLWTAAGMGAFLTPWMGWVTYNTLHPQPQLSPAEIIQYAAQGTKSALSEYDNLNN